MSKKFADFSQKIVLGIVKVAFSYSRVIFVYRQQTFFHKSFQNPRKIFWEFPELCFGSVAKITSYVSSGTFFEETDFLEEKNALKNSSRILGEEILRLLAEKTLTCQ